jgi:hypothetical protein
MNNSQPRTAIPELLLEQWRLGELSEERKLALAKEFSLERIERELAKLEQAELEYWAQRQPQPKKKTIQSWYYAAVPLLAAASAFLVLQFSKVSTEPEATLPDSILLKGDEQPLQAFQQTADGPRPLAEGTVLKAGDTLQLSYQAGAFSHGVIVSVDGRGTVTWHFPVTASGEQSLEKGQSIALKQSYKLDDAPRYERFFFIRSQQRIDTEALQKALKKISADDAYSSARLPIDPSLDQSSLLLRK